MEKLGNEQRDKIAALEKETSSVQKEILKLKELLEVLINLVIKFLTHEKNSKIFYVNDEASFEI